jgi:hypothetical protein
MVAVTSAVPLRVVPGINFLTVKIVQLCCFSCASINLPVEATLVPFVCGSQNNMFTM